MNLDHPFGPGRHPVDRWCLGAAGREDDVMNTSTITLDPPHPVLSPSAAPERPDYHRIARTQANYRWWRPLVTAVVAVAA